MLLSQMDWQNYENAINQALTEFSTKNMIWVRELSNLNRWGEDNTNNKSPNIDIPVLCNYNYYRSWPITQFNESGEYDKQSVQVIIRKQWLIDNGFLTSQTFDYNPAGDRFKIDGILYKANGDTSAAQSLTNDLIFSFILEREIEKT